MAVAMNKDFTAKEAKELAAFYHLKLRNLSDLKKELSDHVNRAGRMYVSLMNDEEAIDDQITSDLQSSRISYRDDVTALIRELDQCYQRQKVLDQAGIDEQDIETIRKDTAVLGKGTSRLKWLFASRDDKEAVIEAYHDLQERQDAFELAIGDLQDQFQKIGEQNDPAAAVQAFQKDKSGYEKIIAEQKEKYDQTYLYRDASSLMDRWKEVSQFHHDLETCEQELTDKIGRDIDLLQRENTRETMKTIPLERLNDGHKGLRLKPLYDAGYENVLDVYNAQHYELVQLRGISEEGAWTLKQEAEKIAQNIKKSLKISLSYDRKTSAAGRLISSVYRYNRYSELQKKCQILYDEKIRRLQLEFPVIAKDFQRAGWLFLSERELQKAREAYHRVEDSGFVDFCDSYELQAIEAINAAHSRAPEDVWEDFRDHSIRYYNTIEKIAPDVLGNDDSRYGLPEGLARQIEEQDFFPEGLLCDLRNYQVWGVKYILHQGKVLLGDEMGLGKTVEAIAAMVSLRNTGVTHFMVVCPASVITNWCREIQKKSRLRAYEIHGTYRMQQLKEWEQSGGVAVTNYETTGHIDLPESFRFGLLVADEAHYMKNPEAARTIHTVNIGLHADRLLLMTGTALENNVDEMIQLIRILQPDVADSVRNLKVISQAPEFRNRIAPVYYRRKRADVLSELPEKEEIEEWCDLSEIEEEAYERALMSRNFAAVRRVSWHVEDIRYSSKAEHLQTILAMAAEEDRKVLIFSFFLDTIGKICEMLGTRAKGPITGAVPLQKRQDIIDDFDGAPAGTALVAQIQSGGTGLNIQSASVVVICEPQLKPSIENQAISRAYRMGQARNVLVYRLLATDTVDERIMERLQEKQMLFDEFADKSKAAEMQKDLQIDDKTFNEIIQEEIERINAKRSQEQQFSG